MKPRRVPVYPIRKGTAVVETAVALGQLELLLDVPMFLDTDQHELGAAFVALRKVAELPNIRGFYVGQVQEFRTRVDEKLRVRDERTRLIREALIHITDAVLALDSKDYAHACNCAVAASAVARTLREVLKEVA